jgi:hypothetical protein
VENSVVEKPAGDQSGGTTNACKHEACSCDATASGYCSEYCESNAREPAVTCACGHRDCVGTQEVFEDAG